MKAVQAVVFGVAMFYLGLVRGTESPNSMLREVVVVTVALIAAAVVWELGARRARARRV